MRPAGERSRVLAVLGPTNTGKTHLAVERMLAHRSGMIGFPLRLLAREIYDRVVRVRGSAAVALVTGEERRVPANPAYFVCTVEAMPLDRPVAFLAVDEIQLCADPERGHVFTDRLLRARGLDETMFLGAETIRPLLRRLVPGVEFIDRPRFSRLTYGGPKKVTRLPRRSAVVAFSASEVYRLAEVMRRQRGGTAVVLGALSPRTRNAQVGLYQAGEVDYLVATDAIGMGLNMDLGHVAFSSLHKFDGKEARRLTVPEVAQIAGRAGRYLRDGTFGTTAELGPLEPELVAAVEAHTFPPLRQIRWRNPDLDLRSVPALLRSLGAPPPDPALIATRDADDHTALAALARDEELVERCRGRAAVELLWEVCRIPDFRKTLADSHVRLLAAIYRHLSGPEGRLPTDWVAAQVARLDRTEGDIDALVARIAHIRTWTYVSHRPEWLRDARHWQERSREIEDRLSDALHERLTERFVDRRSAHLIRRQHSGADLLSAVTRAGEVVVEGEAVGRVEGLRFVSELESEGPAARAALAAARRAVRGEIDRRVARLADAPREAFALTDDGLLAWEGAPVARLGAGPDLLSPTVEALPNDLLSGQARDDVRARGRRWLDSWLRESFAPLYAMRDDGLRGPARGLAYLLGQGLGSAPRAEAEPLLGALGRQERLALRGFGVRFGENGLFMPALLKPDAVRARALLWAARRGARPAPLPPAGRVSLPRDPALPDDYYLAIGYRPCGGVLAIREDMLERLAARLRASARKAEPVRAGDLASLLGCKAEDVPAVLAALGYRPATAEDGAIVVGERRRRRHPAGRHRPRSRPPPAGDSPFAELRNLRTGGG